MKKSKIILIVILGILIGLLFFALFTDRIIIEQAYSIFALAFGIAYLGIGYYYYTNINDDDVSPLGAWKCDYDNYKVKRTFIPFLVVVGSIMLVSSPFYLMFESYSHVPTYLFYFLWIASNLILIILRLKTNGKKYLKEASNADTN